VPKRRRLGAEPGSRNHYLQRSPRRVLDPAGILNPGRAL
jgi:hypothetical protein